MKFFVLTLSLLILREVSASGCHGTSGFRLEPAHTEEIASRSNNKLKLSKDASTLTAKEQDTYCAPEYGEGSRLFDLAQMEEEFENPEDLQHALLPLFKENSKALYFVANDGDIHGPEGESSPQRLVLVLEDENTVSMEQPFQKRVAGLVFMETRDAKLLETDKDVHTLCNIPKPKYEGKDGGDMGMGMGMGMGNMKMTFMGSSTSDSTTKSSWAMPLLGLATVAAVCVAALQTWRARMAVTSATNNPLTQPSINLGGSYSMLSSEDNCLTQELAPAAHSEML